MADNLSDYFRNTIPEKSQFVDEFIDNAHVNLLGGGLFTASLSSVQNFLFPAFLIVHYRGGSVRISHGSQNTLLVPGSLYIFKPYEVYNGTLVGDQPVRFSYLQFSITPYIQSYNLMKTALSLDESCFAGNSYHRIGIVLDDLIDNEGMIGRRAMLGQLAKWTAIRIIADRLNRPGDQALLRENSESRLINQSFDYVAAHLSQPVVIGDIVKALGTSRTSLERSFGKAFGLSPQQALLRYKIERSFEKLQQNLPAKKIAEELGFSSEYHFSNAFKSVMGIRPGAYKRQLSFQLVHQSLEPDLREK